jgi:hypothetical protein
MISTARLVDSYCEKSSNVENSDQSFCAGGTFKNAWVVRLGTRLFLPVHTRRGASMKTPYFTAISRRGVRIT